MSEQNQLPHCWAWADLAELATLINGDRGKNYPSTGAFVPSGVPFINAGHLNAGSIGFSEMNYITEDRYNLLRSGKIQLRDILYCLRGSLGKAALVTNIEKGAIASSLVIIRAADKIDERYLYYFLIGPMGTNEITKYDNGSAQPNLSARSVKAYRVPLAPINEQLRIVAKIEELFSDLDAGIAALERIKANLKRYRAAVLKAAVEGKLTEEWRAKHPKTEPATKLLERILAERRQKWEEDQLARFTTADKAPPNGWREKYVEPAAYDTSGMRGLSEGWCWASAEQCCEYITKGTTPAASELFEHQGEIPFIKIYNLTQDGTLDFRAKRAFISQQTHRTGVMVRSRVVPGDVLINIVGPPLGKVSIVPSTFSEWNVNQAIAILRPLMGFDRRLLCYLLLTDSILSWAIRQGKATAGQFNLTLEIVRRLPLPLPPLEEQEQIVNEVGEKLSQIEAAEGQIEHSFKRASRLRQSILKRAFEGKLVPQDPTDEPADKVLERIRQDRAAGNGSVAPRARRGRASSRQAKGETHGTAS